MKRIPIVGHVGSARRSECKFVVVALLLIMVFFNAGCATVAKGTSQQVTVTTDPAGARCTLTREGTILAVIQPTPGSISIHKDKKDVSVSCERAGYKDSTGVFESKFADATMGNALFGGLIGVAIDASSGAMHEYDPIVTLTMIPLGFSSIADRNVFFDKMRDDFVRDSDESIKLIAEKCQPSRCDYEKSEAEKARVARLAEIEDEREIAKIGESVATTVKLTQQPTSDNSAFIGSKVLTGAWKGTLQGWSHSMSRDSVQMEIESETNQGALGWFSFDYSKCSPYQVEMTKTVAEKWNITLDSKPGCKMTGKFSLKTSSKMSGFVHGSNPGSYRISLSRRN